MSAVYLVRIDDVCPTMNWAAWAGVEEALLQLEIRPIVAVVPDNQDDYLQVDEPDPRFWDRVRLWQGRGWTIGIHGHQHRSLASRSGIIRLNAWSEFAGLPPEKQEEKLRTALTIFNSEGVRPRVWVAPSHSFDYTTVATLRNLGMGVLSDGLSLFPYVDSLGMMWIPQQLWRFRSAPLGVWTVCCHINRWTNEQVAAFARDLRVYRGRIVDMDTVTERYKARRRTTSDAIASAILLTLLRFKRMTRRMPRLHRRLSPVS